MASAAATQSRATCFHPQNVVGLIGVPKILRDTEKDCGKPDYPIIVAAVATSDRAEQRFTLWHETDLACSLTKSALEGRTDMPL